MTAIVRPLSRRAALGAVAALPLTVLAGLAAAQQGASSPAGHEMKAPQTPEEHFARATEYERKAKEYRQEAADHKKMLDAEIKALPPKLKSGPEPSWVGKMRRHCEGYIQKAEALAQEAGGLASYHRFRGKELQGQ